MGKAKAISKGLDALVKRVKSIKDLPPETYEPRIVKPLSPEVSGWHVTQDLAAILKSGALSNRDVGTANVQGWVPYRTGGAYFYADPGLARMNRGRVLENIDEGESSVEFPILRAQMRRGNRLVSDEDVGLDLPWDESYLQGSFATTRPVLLDQVDRIYSGAPDDTRDMIRDLMAKYRSDENNYAKGGAVVGPEPVKSDMLQLISRYLGKAKQLGNNVELPLLGGVGDLLVGEGDEAFDEYSRGYNPLGNLTLESLMGAPVMNSEDAMKGIDAAGAVPLLGLPVRGAQALAKTAAAVPRIFADSMGPAAMSNVVKQKGGNWLAGDVEGALKSLRLRNPTTRTDPIEALSLMRETYPPEKLSILSEESQRVVGDAFARLEPEAAYNQWLDQKLAKYIKNEMATPEDPIRALAERGVLHVEPGQLNLREEYFDNPTLITRDIRRQGGFNPQGEGVNPLARAWEATTDNAIEPNNTPISLSLNGDTNLAAANPWLLKVPPDTKINSLLGERHTPDDLGFTHLTDELRNIIDPNSGLPADLLWRYSDLAKVTVPQAVERVAKVNAWRAANKAEANAKLANNAATVPFKDYPDTDYHWVELKQPKATGKIVKSNKKITVDDEEFFDDVRIGNIDPDDHDAMEAAMELEMGDKIIDEDESMQALRNALKYEGDTMGHCVGGYCDDVASGKSRIYSLRNKKTGEPHTTIEVAPPTHGGMSYEELRKVQGGDVDELDWTPQIVQIKGKGNKAPVEKYLPYVQDFVKSGRWSDVGDLRNTGLQRVDQSLYDLEPGYYSKQELIDAMKRTDKAPIKKANGGLVAASEAGYNADRVNALAQSLLDELNG